MAITGTTGLLGLIGDPVAHSLSPAMHNAALAAMGEDAVYLPFPVKEANLERALNGLDAIGVLGFNVTLPHKQTVLPWMKSITPRARTIGAVNTVYRTIGGWAGTNTDLEGFLHPLRTLEGIDWSQKRALVLGSGGAARAVIQGCFELGLSEVRVVGRTWENIQRLQLTWPALQLHLWSHLAQAIPQTDLVINTTPLGMTKPGADPQKDSPLSEAEVKQLPAGAIVYDLVYVPNPTLLLRMAAEAGHTRIDGLEMLVQQGAAALSIWLQGKSVPVDVMRQAARETLGLTAHSPEIT